MFLSDEEIGDLTGRRQGRKQAQWLAERGYPFELNAAGHPRVLRAFVDKKLGGLTAPPKRAPNLTPVKKAA